MFKVKPNAFFVWGDHSSIKSHKMYPVSDKIRTAFLGARCASLSLTTSLLSLFLARCNETIMQLLRYSHAPPIKRSHEHKSEGWHNFGTVWKREHVYIGCYILLVQYSLGISYQYNNSVWYCSPNHAVILPFGTAIAFGLCMFFISYMTQSFQ